MKLFGIRFRLVPSAPPRFGSSTKKISKIMKNLKLKKNLNRLIAVNLVLRCIIDFVETDLSFNN